MKAKLFLLAISSLLFAACGPSTETLATQTAVAATATTAAWTRTPTVTPSLTATATPTAASTPTTTQVATSTRTSTPTPLPLPTLGAVTLQFDEGVAPDQRETIRQGLALAQFYLGEMGPLTVVAYTDLEALATAAEKFYKYAATSPAAKNFREGFSAGKMLAAAKTSETGSSAIWVWVSDRWKQRSVALKQTALIHEYYHLLQSWSAKKELLSTGPIWLYEGAADIAATTSVAKIGGYNLDEIRADITTRSRGMLSPLNSVMTLQDAQMEDADYPYVMGYLATEYLISKYGDDRQSVLRKFWEAQGAGASWQGAFKATFGMSVDDFYPKFEDYRKTQFPSLCGTVGVPLAQATPAPFGVQFVRQLAPGQMPRFDMSWTNPPNVPYVFCATGTKLPWQPNSVYKFPTGYAGWSVCGANCITIYMRPATPAGKYTFAIVLPDGQRAEATFEHKP